MGLLLRLHWYISLLIVPMLAQSTRVVIPFLANTPDAAEIGFEGAECTVADSTMRCEFRQVFLTTTPVAPDTCMVTTNSYERLFTKQSPTRWVSTEGPAGVCGIEDVATLTDEGGVRWTMELQKRTTRRSAAPECSAPDQPAEVLSWKNIRRALPCKFIQPGDLRR
jgi:hypothetical protein